MLNHCLPCPRCQPCSLCSCLSSPSLFPPLVGKILLTLWDSTGEFSFRKASVGFSDWTDFLSVPSSPLLISSSAELCVQSVPLMMFPAAELRQLEKTVNYLLVIPPVGVRVGWCDETRAKHWCGLGCPQIAVSGLSSPAVISSLRRWWAGYHACLRAFAESQGAESMVPLVYIQGWPLGLRGQLWTSHHWAKVKEAVEGCRTGQEHLQVLHGRVCNRKCSSAYQCPFSSLFHSFFFTFCLLFLQRDLILHSK